MTDTTATITQDGAYEDVFTKTGLAPLDWKDRGEGLARIWGILPWAAVSGWRTSHKQAAKLSRAAARALARAERDGESIILQSGRILNRSTCSIVRSATVGENKGDPVEIIVDSTLYTQGEFMVLKGLMDRDGIKASVKRYLKAVDMAVAGLERSQQPVHKIPDLSRYLQTPNGRQLVEQRIALVDAARGVRNTVVIDGAEDYTIQTAQMSAAQSTIEAARETVCAASGIPARILFGDAVSSGLGANSGESQNWKAQVRQYQETQAAAVLEFLSGQPVEFEDLTRESQHERAQRLERIASALDRLLSHGVLDNEQARKLLGAEGFDVSA
nr:MAG TPA: Portal [Caudoviricetes sp.]